MNIVFQTIQKGFYKVRDWYDPMISNVSKPVRTTGVDFFTQYEFDVHYNNKSVEHIVINSTDPVNWIVGTSPESVAWDKYHYFVNKMVKQKRNRSR